MQFRPFVYDAMNRQVPVAIEPMTPQDAALTDREPLWQTSWASEYLADENYEKYAARVGDELIALAAYEVLPTALVVHIVYMEAQPESNPTLDGGTPKYRGIGRLLIAYGIKLSIDSGLTGDVVLEAKTTSLAKHYEEDFGAVFLSIFRAKVFDCGRSCQTNFLHLSGLIFCEEVLCMDMNKIRPASDAAWYCRKDAEEERFYEIFFQLCRKYSVRWASATPKEKSFIEEVTRVTYERDRAQRLGLPLSEVRPSFAS